MSRVPAHQTDHAEREAERALAGAVDETVRDESERWRISKERTEYFDAVDAATQDIRPRRRAVIVRDADTEVILGAVAADVEVGNLLEVVRAGGRNRVIVEVPKP